MYFLNASAGHWKRCGGPHLTRGPLFAHPCSTQSLIFLLQVALSLASCCQDCVLMPACFKEHFSWSLYRSFGLPLGLVPSLSSPYSMIRGSLEGSIRTTCPAQRRRCCRIVASTLGSRARLRISLFESRISHRVLSSCLNFLCWKFSRGLMSRRYKVQVSQA